MEKLSSLAASNDQIGSVDADEPQYHGAIPNSGTASDAGTQAAESGKDQGPELQKTNDEPFTKSIAKNEDAAVVPTSGASETNGHAKRNDTLKQEDECNQDGNENPEGVPKQDATPKQDDTPKQGEPPRQETAKPIMMPACPLPHQLIQETLRSLDLLCPTGDPDSVKWLDEADIDIASEFFVFRHPLNAPRLREFTYLRERLLDLIEEYEAPPRHWRNVYKDRRNPTTFWTFWIGVVILLLTFIAIFLAGFTYEKTP